MNFSPVLRVSVVLFLTFAVLAGVIGLNHPIVLKWLAGSARVVGRPIKARVYRNEQVIHDIKLFHVDKYWNGQPADYYLLFLPGVNNKRLKLLSLNRKEKYAGKPSSTNIRDYDIIAGLLYQSETGAHFTPMQDDIKGSDFDTQLTFGDGQITLRLPPVTKGLKSDGFRIVL